MKNLFKILSISLLVLSFTSCEDDEEAVEVKDYGLKTFSADYNYTESTYMDQVFFSFSDSLLGTASQDEDDWTQFYLIPDSSATNYTSDFIDDWDLVFTNYTANLGTDDSPFAYNVTGILINQEKSIEVGSFEYTDSEDDDDISTAFTDLSLSDIDTLSYLTDVDAIGYDWKSLDRTTYTYTVNTNYWYIVKLDDETYYKLRIISFYGETTDERIATIQYQLMQ